MDAKEANFLHWLAHFSVERLHAARCRRKNADRITILSSLALGLILGSTSHILKLDLAWIGLILLGVAFVWPLIIIRTLNYIDAQAESELDKLQRKRLKELGFEKLLKQHGL